MQLGYSIVIFAGSLFSLYLTLQIKKVTFKDSDLNNIGRLFLILGSGLFVLSSASNILFRFVHLT
jgi:hypothetical protein